MKELRVMSRYNTLKDYLLNGDVDTIGIFLAKELKLKYHDSEHLRKGNIFSNRYVFKDDYKWDLYIEYKRVNNTVELIKVETYNSEYKRKVLDIFKSMFGLVSKAEKMFNELGFGKDDLSKIKAYDEIVRYSKVEKSEKWYNEKLLMSITFIKLNGKWEIDIYNHKGKIQKIKQKDLKVIQAITEQMKELGWI